MFYGKWTLNIFIAKLTLGNCKSASGFDFRQLIPSPAFYAANVFTTIYVNKFNPFPDGSTAEWAFLASGRGRPLLNRRGRLPWSRHGCNLPRRNGHKRVPTPRTRRSCGGLTAATASDGNRLRKRERLRGAYVRTAIERFRRM